MVVKAATKIVPDEHRLGPLIFQSRVSLSTARRVHQPHNQPDRDHDYRAQQKITPQPAHRVEAHVPDFVD